MGKEATIKLETIIKRVKIKAHPALHALIYSYSHSHLSPFPLHSTQLPASDLPPPCPKLSSAPFSLSTTINAALALLQTSNLRARISPMCAHFSYVCTSLIRTCKICLRRQPFDAGNTFRMPPTRPPHATRTVHGAIADLATPATPL